MKSLVACLAGLLLLAGCLLLGACRVSLQDLKLAPPPSSGSVPPSAPRVDVATLGGGAAPGDADGPGGFVPRGSARNFYTGPGGRLWYYTNNYYWVSETAPREDLWIKAEVVEQFQDLRKWPDGSPVSGPEPKVTVEYWEVGPTGRSVRLDNHKDYCLLSDQYTAGAITVEVTLTLGHLKVKDPQGGWVRSREAYVLESRNYSKGGGIGSERTHFRALPTEAVTVWGYKIPWSTHPQRLTRSSWRRMKQPEFDLRERRAPPTARPRAPAVTPRAAPPKGT